MKITFNDSAKEFVLDAFNVGLDRQGFLVDNNLHKKVLSEKGEEIHISDFCGVKAGDSGQRIFLKTN